MSFSIQTNVNSLIAQENLRVNGNFQSLTIQRLTSGYRINSSGDDAAGLAIANKFRSDIAELGQGVRNANDGISTLQIIDGGMNNVSKMLDRLRILATQSASDSFKGTRTVVNQEFQSLLAEIDRQAQAIGLDQNGQYAKLLAVFIGGGAASGTGAISPANGTVNLDLTASTVDTRSLGLKGMQVVAGTVDIGPGSSTHTVAQILADAGNTTVNPGFTDLYFAGPGFADSSKVKVSVNLAGVTDITTLVTGINTAIQTAGNGGSQAATAFKNAGVVASVHTDASGGQQVAFTSSTTAFQVGAGDVMANALMGNLTGTLGTAMSTTVTGAATAAGGTAFTPTGVTVRITGAGMTSPVDLTFDTGSTTTALAITDLIGKVANSADLQAVGITASGSATNPMVFTSARGEKFSVMATGDTNNRLGLGSFVAGAGSAVDYTTITAGTNYDNTTQYGTATLEFSINGAASSGNSIAVNLAAGNATSGTLTGTAVAGDAHSMVLTITVDSVAKTHTIAVGAITLALALIDINTQWAADGVVATSDAAGHIVLTSTSKGANSTLAVSGAASTVLFGAGPPAGVAGVSRTLQSVVDALNAGFAGDTEMTKAGLQAAINGTAVQVLSQNSTYLRVNARGTTAGDVGFGITGATFTSSLTVASATNIVDDSNGASNSTALSYAALAYGNDDQAITVSANDVAGAIQSKTVTLHNDGAAAREGRSIDETINYINTQLQQSNNATLQKIVAVKEDVAGAEKINFLSSLTAFSVSVGSSPNSNGVSGGAASTVASAVLGTGSNMSVDTKAGALLAVSAVATAVTTLGSAQAAVGKGQNQLNYAIGLAQSQVSNFAAAESRIRDADVAAEAANLTKATVLQQTSLAAMAQANSAPQAVLALLRG